VQAASIKRSGASQGFAPHPERDPGFFFRAPYSAAHLLEHEDGGMMGTIHVVARGASGAAAQ